MTQDEFIRIARKAGIRNSWDLNWFDPQLEAFAKLIEQRKCKELADKIQLMPFGDTAASFAQWVREQA